MRDSEDTRQNLLLAAGQLFAEHGVDGTSIRAIADRANANIAAVNYHFGSKENLYREALLYVGRMDKEALNTEAFAARARTLTSPQEFADLIAEMVALRFHVYLRQDGESWHSQLFLRGFLRATPEMTPVVEELLAPEQRRLIEILQRANPKLTTAAAERHALSLLAEVSFYCFARYPLLAYLAVDDFPQTFIDETAHHVACLMCGALGLPQPAQSACTSGPLRKGKT